MDKTTDIIDKYFAPKKWGSTEDDDTEYTYRAFIRHTVTDASGRKTLWVTMFPPTQYKSVGNKSDFNRALTDYLEPLDWFAVEVTQGGKAAFSFNRNP